MGHFPLQNTRAHDDISFLTKYSTKLANTDGINNVTFEKSTSYLDTDIWDDVVDNVKAILPHVKVIAMLCDPAERLYAEFKHWTVWERTHFQQMFSGHRMPANFTDFFNILKDGSEFCGYVQAKMHPNALTHRIHLHTCCCLTRPQQIINMHRCACKSAGTCFVLFHVNFA